MSAGLFTASRFAPHCTDWKEAIRIACMPLEEQGLIHTSYAQNIIAATEKTGPWYVLTPGFALPHARPDEGVLSKTSVLSLLRLGDEVVFPGGESVGLMVVLAAADSEQHIGTIQQLVNCWMRMIGWTRCSIRNQKRVCDRC